LSEHANRLKQKKLYKDIKSAIKTNEIEKINTLFNDIDESEYKNLLNTAIENEDIKTLNILLNKPQYGIALQKILYEYICANDVDKAKFILDNISNFKLIEHPIFLYTAVLNGRKDLVKLLLDKDVNVNATYEGKNPLDIALFQHNDIATMLLKAKAKPKVPINNLVTFAFKASNKLNNFLQSKRNKKSL
jgi:hypothetical protein